MVGVKHLDSDPKVVIKLIDGYGDNYQSNYDRQTLHLELTGIQTGETDINELLILYNDGTEEKVKLGDLIYKLRESSNLAKIVTVNSCGSNSSNKDLTDYVI